MKTQMGRRPARARPEQEGREEEAERDRQRDTVTTRGRW